MGGELVKKEESIPFVLMDKLDDELIIKELEGRMPDILTYHFKDKGQEIWGLSKAGVDEAKGELGKQGECIRELELQFIDGKDEAYFNAKAGRYVISKDGREVLLDTAFGTKRQSKYTTKHDGSVVNNPFWYEAGAIKACRNASFRLIPKSVTHAVIEYAKKQGRVKEVKPEFLSIVIDEPKKEEPQFPLEPSINFLEEMAKYRVKVGKGKFEEILTGRYTYMKPEEVKSEEQKTILEEMEIAYRERIGKK